MLVRIVREICAEEDISISSFSYDWIMRLEKGGRYGFIYGYTFCLNGAAAAKICDDKCAASDILLRSGIPAVEHHYFMAPGNIHFIGENGNWARIVKLFEKYETLVCKANSGTGGLDVFLIKDQLGLETAAHEIFTRNSDMAVSPYYPVKKEYRAIVLGGEVKLVYEKNIPFVEGDGKKTARRLVLDYMSANNALIGAGFDFDGLDKVLPEGEKFSLNWKSNLGLGASPEIVKDENLLSGVSSLSVNTAEAVSIDFASVDIIDTSEGLKVLEVNCGVMMEAFIRSAPENYIKAKGIYREAILAMMGGASRSKVTVKRAPKRMFF